MKSSTRRKVSQLQRGRQNLRKIVHIAVGMFGFLYAFLEWDIILFVWLISIFCAWFLPSRIEALEVILTRKENRLGYSPAMVLYGAVLALSCLIFQNTMMDSLIVLAAVAFGDGFSGLFGSNYSSTPLPYNKDKTLGGLFAFIIFGTIGALALMFFYAVFKIHIPFHPTLSALPIFRVLIIMVVCAIVESIPWRFPDNLPVGVVAIIAALLTSGIAH